MPTKDPLGVRDAFRPEREGREPVEDFRYTPEMNKFRKVFKRMRRITDFLQRGMAVKMHEFMKSRNVFGDAVESMGVLSERTPGQGRQTFDIPMQNVEETFEQQTEEFPQRAAERGEEAPFGLGGIMTTLGERKRMLGTQLEQILRTRK